MKVLLLKDVYKLGRAGDVKRVADGYGRNFLLPQGLAVLATSGALKQVEHIRKQATTARAALNQEMSSVGEVLSALTLSFPAKAGETGKLYGSITPQMIVDAVREKTGVELNRRQLDSEPIRTLGEHKVHIRLTMDIIPEIMVFVHREGEAVETSESEAVEKPQVRAGKEAEAGSQAVEERAEAGAKAEADAEVKAGAETEVVAGAEAE
jgi:large subunit ribosomal protein L9